MQQAIGGQRKTGRRLALVCCAALGLGACALSPTANPKMVSIVPGPDVPAGAKGPNGEPYCREVGGYDAYYKRTGKSCFLGPDGFNDSVYWEPVLPI